MATVGDVINRADALLRKYGKYDLQMQAKGQGGGGKDSGDAFEEELKAVDAEVVALMQQAEEVAGEKNRAAVAAKNAELRRAKNAFLTGRIQTLQKKAGKGRNLSKEATEARLQAVERLVERVKAIPDGVRRMSNPAAAIGQNRPSGTNLQSGFTKIEFDPKCVPSGPGAFRHTEQTQAFEKDWEAAKKRQDAALERIDRGVGVLGNLARDMQEELDQQNPFLDAMESQMDRMGGELGTRNKQLKGALRSVRSGRNFCLDVLLISIFLGLGAYIYSLTT